MFNQNLLQYDSVTDRHNDGSTAETLWTEQVEQESREY